MPDVAADRLPPLTEEQMTAEQRAAAAEISSGPRGAVIGPFAPLLRSPELMTRLQKVGEYLRSESPLDRRLFEMTILYVARWWDQQFEWTFHHPLALAAGLDPAVADAIAENRRPDGMDAAAAAVWDLLDELYFVTPFRTLVEKTGLPAPELEKQLRSLLEQGLIRSYWPDPDTELAYETTSFGAIARDASYLASKEGLLKHNTR